MAMRKSMLIGIVIASMLSLSACAGSGDPGDQGSAGPTEDAITKITVGVIPIGDTAPAWLGKEKGFFAEEGLDITIQPTTGGAAAVPGVVSGSYDFAFGNYVSGMVANDKGLDLKYVANGASATGDPGFQAVIVRDDSPIKSAKDLAGKRVSVNNLANINDTTIRGVVDDDGGDSSTIEFVEVAFPDAVAAVENKQVDAATVNPFVPSMLETGKRVIMFNFSAFDPNLDVAGYFTTAETVKNKPELVEAFQTAMNKSLDYAQEHPDEVRQIMTTYTKFTPELLENMTLPQFRSEFNRESLEKLGAAAVSYGTLSAAPDLDALLP